MTPIITKLAGAGMLALITLSGCTVVVDEPPIRPGPGPRPLPPQQSFCPEIYAPVCGERRGRIETLPNQCVAESRGFRVIADGECRVGGRPPISRPPGGRPPRPDRPEFCTREYAPVCARRGGQVRTFGNECTAKSEGFRVIADGPCG